MVKWLGEAGFDIGTGLTWIPEVDAGMERTSFDVDCYVVKNPWMFALLDDIDPADVDVLVIPVRDLEAAADSRIRAERNSLEGRRIQNWNASTAAGVVYPVNTQDAARWLAEGFYRLVQWAVHHDVPIVFVDFPRIVQDENYAVCKVAEMVDTGTYMNWTPDLAIDVRTAHRKVARK